jgi:pseudouridine synthase
VEVRLQKILSAAGIASRRAAERLIVDGRVSVNGRMVTELGARADPAADDVRVDGQRVGKPAVLRYILLNKPVGVVTTRSDPEGRPTVVSLLGSSEYLYPVGRLDYDSEGLVLLTNDGDLAARLMHPRNEVPKVYQARVRGVPDEKALARLARGVVLDGRRTAPADVRLLPTRSSRRDAEESIVEVTLREGRNRQVRRMCEAVGHRVRALRRVQFGPLHDAQLRPGMFRELTPKELRALKDIASLGAPPAAKSGSGKPRSARPAPTASRPAPPRTKIAPDSRHRRRSSADSPRRG